MTSSITVKEKNNGLKNSILTTSIVWVIEESIGTHLVPIFSLIDTNMYPAFNQPNFLLNVERGNLQEKNFMPLNRGMKDF